MILVLFQHNLEELQLLTSKWREVSQEAAHQLLDIINHPDKSLKNLLNCLKIDHSTIHYSLEDDEFY